MSSMDTEQDVTVPTGTKRKAPPANDGTASRPRLEIDIDSIVNLELENANAIMINAHSGNTDYGLMAVLIMLIPEKIREVLYEEDFQSFIKICSEALSYHNRTMVNNIEQISYLRVAEAWDCEAKGKPTGWKQRGYYYTKHTVTNADNIASMTTIRNDSFEFLIDAMKIHDVNLTTNFLAAGSASA